MKIVRLPKDDVYNLIKSRALEGISVFEIEERLTGKSQQEMIEESNNGIAEYDNSLDELRLEGKIFIDSDTHLWFADIHLSPERQVELRKKDEEFLGEMAQLGEQLKNMTQEERNELKAKLASSDEVPEDVYEELMAAESKGSFLHKKIKGVYRYEQVDP